MSYDYSNLVLIEGGVIYQTPVPDMLYGIDPAQLADPAIMASFDPSLDLADKLWYPVVDNSPTLNKYQSYTGDPALTIDTPNRRVLSVRQVRDWTADEILAYKQSTIRHISKLAFRNRFTQAEKVALEMALLDNPADTQTARQTAAGLRVMEKDLQAAEYVDLNLADTQAGIRNLETLGIIAAGRADQIIWGDIEPGELP